MTLRKDEHIKKDVVDQLVWDGRVDASDVTVEVTEGCVTLKGSVPSSLSRSSAEKDASVVPGVRDVRNALSVRFPVTPPVPDDAELKMVITNLFALYPNLDPSRIKVMVQGGLVTLEGSVDALWKKGLVGGLIAQQRGIFAVDNKLSVVPTRGAADQATADEIRAALGRHVLIPADRITVSVEEGYVTLSGNVSNVAAREAAEQVASYTFGVIDVHNEIEVAEP
jgi:osmotically-inducible protein OsmY